MRRRLVSVVSGVAALAAASVLVPQAASAVPSDTLTSTTAASPVLTGSPVTFRYTLTTAVPHTGASFLTHQDRLLPADIAAVTVDGTPVPQAQVSSVGVRDISFPLGTAGALPAGTHTVTFVAQPADTGNGATSSTAEADYTDGSPATVSSPVAITVNQTDISVTQDAADFPGAAPIGTGRVNGTGFLVKNLGIGAPAVTLAVDVPAGAVFVPEASAEVANDPSASPSPLSCAVDSSVANRYLCAVGPVDATGPGVLVLLGFTTTANPPVGSTVTVGVTAQLSDPALLDTNPADDLASGQLSFLGVAHLSPGISVTTHSVTVGTKTVVTLTLHNNGPQAGVGAVGIAALENTTFAIADFDGKTDDPNALLTVLGGLGSSSGSGSASASALLARLSRANSAHAAQALAQARSTLHHFAAGLSSITTPGSAGSGSGDGVLWTPGTLAAGQTVTAHLTLKATAVGRSGVALVALSQSGDPACDLNSSTQPSCVAITTLRAVAPVAVAPTKASTGGSELANTGSPTGIPAGIGVGLIVLGAGALWLGRRRTA